MKSLKLIFVFAIGVVASQNVRTRDRLGERLAYPNQFDNGDSNWVSETDIVEPNRQICPGQSNCHVVPPIVYQPDCQGQCTPYRPRPPIKLTPVEVDPIENEEIVPMQKDVERICPIGTSLNGSVCMDFTSYPYDCPHGYTWTNNRCVLTRKNCPLNFDWNGGSCVQKRICPRDYNWENGRCVQPNPNCPSGSRWNGIVCEVREIQCEPGSYRKGNECVSEKYACPYGFTERNNVCIKQQTQPTCLSGYTYDYTSGFCTIVRQKCPSGSSLTNGQCRSVIYSCPSGSYKVGERCFTNVTPRTTRPPSRTPPCTPCTPSYNPSPCYSNCNNNPCSYQQSAPCNTINPIPDWDPPLH